MSDQDGGFGVNIPLSSLMETETLAYGLSNTRLVLKNCMSTCVKFDDKKLLATEQKCLEKCFYNALENLNIADIK